MYGRQITIVCVLGLFGLAARADESPPKLASDLKVTATLTYGMYGPSRPAVIAVGDQIHAMQTIAGLARDERGMVDYSFRMELLDQDGDPLVTSPWRRSNVKYSADLLHHDFFVQIPGNLDPQKSGKYVWRFQVEDHLAGAKNTSEIELDITLPKGVTVTRLRGGHDQQAQGTAGTTFAQGEVIYIHAALSRFGVIEGRSDLRATVTVLDDRGKLTNWPAVVVNLSPETSRYETDPKLGIFFQFNAIRPGRYIAQLHVEDLTGGTSATEFLPLLVTESPDWMLDANQIAKLKEQAEGKPKAR